jgi:hypothetical protein
MDRMDPPAPRFTRRRALRLVGGAALAAIPAARSAGEAGAARQWRRTDPVVKIDGRVADVFLASDRRLRRAATGPTELVVALPPGVPGRLLAVDRGFGGHGYVVEFVEDAALPRDDDGFAVRVDAYVPSADGSLPLVVDFAPRSSGLAAARTRGRVNTRWVSLRTSGTTRR